MNRPKQQQASDPKNRRKKTHDDTAMHYRSINDLNHIIVDNLHRIPSDVDLIVAVPRSGLLAAVLIALHRNLPITDVQSYVSGRLMNTGMQRAGLVQHCQSLKDCRRALVFDDSILSGSEMTRVKSLVKKAGLDEKSLYGAAIYAPDRLNDIDIGFDLCPTPRVFEWNLMHGHMLPKSYVDIDGVLCVDPSEEQNDDGERYVEFVRNARPLLRPTVRIGTLITSRLEKYRDLTEAWLDKCGIKHDQLIMMDYATMEERKAAQQYAQFKATAYAKSDALLFIESSDSLAADIAKLSGKPALCIETNLLYGPTGLPFAKQRVRTGLRQSQSLVSRGIRKVARLLSMK